MLLMMDAGNSEVKWRYVTADGHDAIQRAALGAVLAEPARYFNARPDRVAIAHVAGDAARAVFSNLFAAWQAPVHWIASQAEAYGVRNEYEQATQLGVDRWLGLVAARAEMAGACVIASVGTALTVDMLAASGAFLGGVIAPGPALMRAALAQGTAAVAPAPGRYRDFPRNTADAVESGIAQALCGPIERSVAALSRAGETPAVLVTGGAAGVLAACLNTPHRVVDNLPLQGLRIIAQREGWL